MQFTPAPAAAPLASRLPRLLEPRLIRQVVSDLGLTFRRRVLDPVTTLHVLVLQALWGNTALTDLRIKAALDVTAGALCRARQRLPLAVFQEVLARLGRRWEEAARDDGLWHGHRVLLVDGSSCSMPDTAALNRHYGQSPEQKRGCGFPIAHLLGVFHAGTGLLLEWIDDALYAADQPLLAPTLPRWRPGDVLVGDRAYGNFPLMAALARHGLEAVFRVNQCMIVDFTPHRPHTRPGSAQPQAGLPRSRWVRALGVCDQVVEWLAPATRPRWTTPEEWADWPPVVRVRELRYRAQTPGFRSREITPVTTLLDARAYPADELARLYFSRWRIEGYFRDLKTTMKMEVLKCKSVDGVRKELAVFALAYNLVRLVALEASRRQGVAWERISFVDALRWLATTAVRGWSGLVALVVNPVRPGRFEPRARKRRPKPGRLLTQPRHLAKQLLLKQEIAS